MKPYISFISAVCFTLIGCQSSQSSRYSQQHDSIPSRLPNQQELIEPLPKVVAKSRGGNKDYQVFGIDYQVMTSAEGYTESGIASWYGEKFHGHLTSNGEVYDMYGFSAAHKALPLPTYVQVTNLDNQRKVIVRVNDRGPFHQDRLIDLSYSAAYKLGMLDKGTARVKVEAITKTNLAKFIGDDNGEPQGTPATLISSAKTTPQLDNPGEKAPSATALFKPYIHVLVTRNKTLADNTVKGLSFLLQVPVNLSENNELYRVQIGPISQAKHAEQLLASLHNQGYTEAYPLFALK
ncbi:septal ring lytic transglycosylase RlpA family protein [Thalassotalea ponticola]|uniref:septal ring lytic transglycosylase RlpA family protein n=1 Tax=Thalassotalea ponticola TaxID=1523392 RepID=UPI0025B61F32|nr:septal ring lytic transglycosylase RlpA family protein [Thalassotalea ponticola]MDN3652571.1 septal ring lytic transglycosylase RlpA family protein [Thalassotalea ponticola]